MKKIGKIFPFFYDHVDATDWTANTYTPPIAPNLAEYCTVSLKNAFCSNIGSSLPMFPKFFPISYFYPKLICRKMVRLAMFPFFVWQH